MTSKPAYHSLNLEHRLTDTQSKSESTISRQSPLDRSFLQARLFRDGQRIRWLPWLLLTFTICFAFFLSMIYAVFEITSYEDARTRFLIIAWVIFLLPTLVVAFLALTPLPESIRDSRHGLSERKPPPSYLPIVNILNALTCFVSVAVYLYVSAFQDYNTPHWVNSVSYEEFLPIPSFAWIFELDKDRTNRLQSISNVTARAALGSSFDEPCQIYNGTSSTVFHNCTCAMSWQEVGPYQAYVFDAREVTKIIDNSTINNLRSSIWFAQYIAYNSTVVPYPSSLYLTTIIFDPDVNLTKAWQCGLISAPRLPAFSATFFNLQLTATRDKHRLLNVASSNPNCKDTYKALFPNSKDVYRSWSWTSSNIGLPDLKNCDSTNPNGTAFCTSQVILTYDSQLVQSTQSRPGTSRLGIWLNAGSIIGGVQFFFWFLAMLAAY